MDNLAIDIRCAQSASEDQFDSLNLTLRQIVGLLMRKR